MTDNKSLRVLNLNNNKIKQISFEKNANLEMIFIKNNPLKEINTPDVEQLLEFHSDGVDFVYKGDEAEEWYLHNS